ncbi:MAG: NosD domain-containing protein [Promethearchaeota archaeon]
MLKNIKKINTTISIIFIIVSLSVTGFTSIRTKNLDIKEKKKDFIAHASTHSPPIIIDGNSELQNFPNITGAGTPQDPLIISNFEIYGSKNTSCISISNTNLSLKIMNNTISEGGPYAGGIMLINCSNVIIEQNTLLNNYIGIYITGNSKNITVLKNEILYNYKYGIYLSETLNTIIKENIVRYNYVAGISSLYLEYSNITANTFENNRYSLELWLSSNISIEKNLLVNSSNAITCHGCNNNNIIMNNIINSAFGIFIEDSRMNGIFSNNFSDVIRTAVYLKFSDFNNISFNFFNCSKDLAWVNYRSVNNTFINNTINDSLKSELITITINLIIISSIIIGTFIMIFYFKKQENKKLKNKINKSKNSKN